MQFAKRLDNVETSAIRELFKLLGKPGIISFAGGFPDSAMFDVAGISAASAAALQQEAGAALQYGATEGYQPLREQLSSFMAGKGVPDVAPDQLIVTTGSQQALDLLGKTMVGEGDKVIVEGPTFLATIQCFRLYGAEVISAPVDEHGVKTDELEKLIAEHKPKLVYLIPTFGDVPPIESLLVEVPDPEGPYGAKGLGEHVLIPTAPAILNAIRHATGAEVTRVPALPHRVLDAMRGAKT